MSDLMELLAPVWNTAKTIIGIGGLIFVHELGHFLVGRWCGVRAEAFSIGFGKVLLRWQPGETEYRLSALPLGGYVKFLAENPGEEGSFEPDSFPAATYPRKAAILLAGVVMNVIAAFFLFIGGYSMGVDSPAPEIGYIQPGSAAWDAGLRTGDRFVTMNDQAVLDFPDIQQATILNDEIVAVIERDGETLAPITLRPRPGDDGLPKLGILPAYGNVIGVSSDAPAHQAGFRTGDVVKSVNGTPAPDMTTALELHADSQGPSVWVVERDGQEHTFELPLQSIRILGALSDSRVFGAVRGGSPAARAGLRPTDRPVSVGPVATPTVIAAIQAIEDPANPGPLRIQRDGDGVEEIPLPAAEEGNSARKAFVADLAVGENEPGEVYVHPVSKGESALTAAGIGPGSKILELDGRSVSRFADVQAITGAVRDDGRDTVAVRWQDAALEEHEGTLALVDSRPQAGLVGLGSVPKTVLIQESNVLAAAGLGLERTHRWMMRIVGTLKQIVSGNVSARNLSGPIAIAKTSYKLAESSLADYLLFLGMISVNLAVLNILPIPLLDGGQLAMYTAEKIYGKELPEPLIAGLQWTGLVLLLGLMVFVIGNDIVNML